ncbi:methylated-DNA--[protein]-cysteine S-methyltransferase [Ramlibacter tataouinensis]|uniref:Methylated-DNA--protein-cysteine methyltransferase n=1 Tax=Ramlibacter tataouinensis (strain ATCC BAA-407 / DSM 14655 / LMG 21543 / TTB310) TaxID=365046 RepID=F5Y0W1_RAMTT|nr:methylated-DNA--[protein]-cysteine S-methyltransferase [Ramlibacter tataouinensis]AEG92179.1 Candidate O6-methylguanine-DNA methyltransferase [Ramlibacter tataouinensis TTB310]
MRFHPSLATAGYASPLGPMLVAASPRGLAGLWFEGQRHWPAGSAGWAPDPAHAVLRETLAQLDAYFGGRLVRFDLPLDLQAGTPFQQAVWQALCGIPRGATLSYGAVGERIGQPAAVRAVGAAVGRNPVSIVVPCHRVLGKAGALTGYAGGLERKTALLRLEGVA